MTSNIFSHCSKFRSRKSLSPSSPSVPLPCRGSDGLERWAAYITSSLTSLRDVAEGVKSEIKTAEIYAKMTDGLQSLELDTTLLVGCKWDRKSLDSELFRQRHHSRRSRPAAKGFSWRLNWSRDWTLSCQDLCDLQGRIWVQYYLYSSICRNEKIFCLVYLYFNFIGKRTVSSQTRSSALLGVPGANGRGCNTTATATA